MLGRCRAAGSVAGLSPFPSSLSCLSSAPAPPRCMQRESGSARTVNASGARRRRRRAGRLRSTETTTSLICKYARSLLEDAEESENRTPHGRSLTSVTESARIVLSSVLSPRRKDADLQAASSPTRGASKSPPESGLIAPVQIGLLMNGGPSVARKERWEKTAQNGLGRLRRLR